MRKRETIITIFCFCLIFFIISGCSSKSDIVDVYSDNLADVTSNILGLMERQGDYIYYASAKHGYKLYKIKTDGTDKEKLSNDSCKIIGVIDNYVFYKKHGKEGAIYRIDIKGKHKTLLTNDFSTYIKVYGDWIYYFNEDDNCLYKMNLDGTQKTKLNNNATWNYVIEGNWIFFENIKDWRKLYKIKTDGTSSAKLVDDSISEFTVFNDVIYYVNNSDEDRLYKVNVDGSGREPFMDYSDIDFAQRYEGAYSLQVEGDYLYYSNGNYVSRVKLDGTDWEELFGTNSSKFTIDNGWIYAYVDYRNSLLTRYEIQK